VPYITASDYHDNWTYVNGVFDLWFAQSWNQLTFGPETLRRNLLAAGLPRAEVEQRVAEWYAQSQGDLLSNWVWQLPLRSFTGLRGIAPWYYTWLRHPNYDRFWARLDVERRYQKVKVPVLNIGGWYDIFEVGTVRNFLGMRSEGGTPEARAGTKLIMRASAHAPAPNTPPTAVGDVDFGPNNTLDVDAVSLRFYDRDLAEGSARIEILRAWTIPAVDLPRRVGPDGVGQRRKVDMRAATGTRRPTTTPSTRSSTW
jgi:uncharacterized protein